MGAVELEARIRHVIDGGCTRPAFLLVAGYQRGTEIIMAPETNNSAKQHMSPSPMRRHLSQAEARQLDSELMSDAAGWSLAQLMELVGGAVVLSRSQLHGIVRGR